MARKSEEDKMDTYNGIDGWIAKEMGRKMQTTRKLPRLSELPQQRKMDCAKRYF